MNFTHLIVPLLVLMIPAFGQLRENIEPLERFCEIREQKLPVTQRLEVLASPNGGVSVRGWNRQEILVRARVETLAPSEGEAKTLASQVRIQAGAGRVSATGPEGRNYKEFVWSVSYEVFAPHRIDLKASSVNGGVSISDVEGDISYSTVNGGVNV